MNYQFVDISANFMILWFNHLICIDDNNNDDDNDNDDDNENDNDDHDDHDDLTDEEWWRREGREVVDEKTVKV